MRQLSTFMPDTIQQLSSYILRVEEDSLLMPYESPQFGSFEFLPTQNDGLSFIPDTVTEVARQIPDFLYNGELLSFPYYLQTFFFACFLVCFLLFAVLHCREGVSLSEMLRGLSLKGNSLPQIRKEKVTTTEAWGEFFLFLQTMLISGMVVYRLLWEGGISTLSVPHRFLALAVIWGAISLLAAIKILFYGLIGVLFLTVDLRNWISQYARMLEVAGVFLFLPALFFVFLHEWKMELLIFFGLVFLLTRLFIAMGVLNIFVKNKIGRFYFFVYLCGTEIAPLLLIYKGIHSVSNFVAI